MCIYIYICIGHQDLIKQLLSAAKNSPSSLYSLLWSLMICSASSRVCSWSSQRFASDSKIKSLLCCWTVTRKVFSRSVTFEVFRACRIGSKVGKPDRFSRPALHPLYTSLATLVARSDPECSRQTHPQTKFFPSPSSCHRNRVKLNLFHSPSIPVLWESLEWDQKQIKLIKKGTAACRAVLDACKWWPSVIGHQVHHDGRLDSRHIEAIQGLSHKGCASSNLSACGSLRRDGWIETALGKNMAIITLIVPKSKHWDLSRNLFLLLNICEGPSHVRQAALLRGSLECRVPKADYTKRLK